MPIQCPACKEQLFLRIEKVYYMSMEEVGLEDVIPGETVDSQTNLAMHCINCGWVGWTDEYHQETNGIASLHARRSGKVTK